MKTASKKFTSLILALILTFSVPIWSKRKKVNAAEPVQIGYSVSKDIVGQGDTVEVKLFFKDYEKAAVRCTAFEYDLYVDPTIFSVESSQIHFDGTGAMMNKSQYNESQKLLKNIYFNPQAFLPQNSVDIATFNLKVLKEFTETTDVELTVKTSIVMDGENNRYDVKYDTPVITCGKVSQAVPTDGIESATQGVTPVVTPSATPSVTPNTTHELNPSPTESVQIKTYTVSYMDSNGRLLWTEKVQQGDVAQNIKTPNRPGYVFNAWQVDKGDLGKVECDITATASYIKSEDKYTINVEGGKFLNSDAVSVQFEHDECVIVSVDNIAEKGMNFLGWKKSGSDAIVSYSKTYSFLATESVDVSAVFSEEKITPTPSIVMYEHSFYRASGVFKCERYIPSEYVYLGSGIIITKTESTGMNDSLFVLENSGVSTYRAQDSAINAQFSVVHGNVMDAMYARAYLIYKTISGETAVVYSNIASYVPSKLF